MGRKIIIKKIKEYKRKQYNYQLKAITKQSIKNKEKKSVEEA